MSTTQPPTNPLPLPEALNPDALDVLSELANLLTRLRALPTSTTAPSTTSGATPAAPTSHATPTPTALLSSQASARKAGGSSSSSELTLKEIPVATDALKHRFQRARNLIRTTLPDLDRGIAEQEVEIKALEARIARQRDTLAKLREVGERLAGVLDLLCVRLLSSRSTELENPERRAPKCGTGIGFEMVIENDRMCRFYEMGFFGAMDLSVRLYGVVGISI
ncbi:RNA polymerase II transcription mediator complex subunit 9-domain-containing protein [Xylaria bambusicola]|uniref:RNA polymerase II transcription mediator complex subunit 9-domain-containing protein n=1 Tax=Xylaria bambusicola TaxID=326684 RepID=UPI002007EBB0|nr:RNA polymerase II transcription mediator complex subunit 9-domain-containing protein [Xylaria bambusicola]KAI0506498.1 RNA polymerase II transcription mediator complex subunit 9-domain-containing protein [Xylaria bambusicola]